MSGSTQIASAPEASAAPGSDMNHIYCCDPNTAWCGADISDHVEVAPDVPVDCVVCADLEDLPCPECGN